LSAFHSRPPAFTESLWADRNVCPPVLWKADKNVCPPGLRIAGYSATLSGMARTAIEIMIQVQPFNNISMPINSPRIQIDAGGK
jgi:hypothetical protein